MSEPLPPDQSQGLLPALRHVAELVQANPQVRREDLALLLLGSGLDEEWALNELERWVKILATIWGVTDATRIDIARRALTLRGIPEVPAKLAVDVAAAPLPRPPTVLPIQSSEEAIGFGELPPGEGARAELKVSGGPGHAMVGSHLISVQPEAFGPEETTLVLTVQAGAEGQVLWDALILESTTERIKVEITARWTGPFPESKEDHFPPAREDVVPLTNPFLGVEAGALRVPRDGGLEDVIARVNERGSIYLEAGEHHLARSLTVAKSVTLLGAGKDRCRIIGSGAEFVLRFTGTGRLAVSDLTVEFDGEVEDEAVLVHLAGGEVELKRCGFKGQDDTDGLLIGGNTGGLVQQCEFTAHGDSGIVVTDEAHPTLEGNTCWGNGGSGIDYRGSAGGVARQNACHNNYVGIRVAGQAQPTLEANTCRGNKWSGISFHDSAAGTARGNTCSSNQSHGIQVRQQARPLLEANTAQGNKGNGIAYFESAAGTACHNICDRNEYQGIYLGKKARPFLEGNKV